MAKSSFLFGVVLLVSLLVVSCGIPQEQFDTTLAERDAALVKAESLQAEVESLKGNLDKVENQITTLGSDLSKSESELSEAKSDLSKAKSFLSEADSDLATAQGQISSLRSGLKIANSSLAAAEAQIAKLEAVYKIVLFFDDFEDGDAAGWNLEGDWSVIQEDGNYILQGVGPCSADVGPQEWTNYTLETRIKFSQSANVNFRLTPAQGTGYFFNLVPEGPMLYKELLDRRFLAKSAASLQQNQWIDLKIEVKGDNMKLYIGGNLRLSYTDSEPLLSGTIGFESPENSVVYVDDVIVMVAK